MCLYILREKCTGVQKNSAFGALCEASGAFHICGATFPAEDILRVAQK